MEELERSTTAGEAMHARKAQRACVRAPTHSGIPVAKSTGKPDRRYSTDGRHGATGDENAQAPAHLIPEIIQVTRRSARISKTGAPLQGQHTNADADSGSSTPPERIGLHGGTPNKAGAANNHATRQSTATGCVATDTHCVSLKGAALQGTPSSQPTSVTTPNNPKPGQQQDLSTPSAATAASTSPATIDDVLATKTPSPQDLLKDATEMTTNTTPPTPTMTTPTSTQRRFPSSSLFHLITMGSTPQPRRKPEPMWKTPKMLRKKKRGTRYPPTTGKTLDVVTDPKTPTRLLPPPRPTTPDHDYISADRNDDFDAVNRNHAFDNDFDLDMHEPGD